jgi:enolase
MGGFDKYGANTLIATEYAILRAWSDYVGLPVYAFFNKNPKLDIRPLSNVVGGGAHAKWKGSDIQEFLVLPKTKSVSLGIFINSLIHKVLQEKLSIIDRGFLGAKNDEGAWVTTLRTEETLALLNEVRDRIKSEEGVEVDLGVDIAASQLFDGEKYIYRKEGWELTREEQIEKVLELADAFDIYYIEDPLNEEDFEGFADLNRRTSRLIVGDDLTVTNPERIEEAIKKRSVNAVIIKPNQVGSLVQTVKAVELCKKHGVIPVLSHRSGETESNILAHLAVGLETPIVKFGIVNGERIAKLNELIRIEEKLSS